MRARPHTRAILRAACLSLHVAVGMALVLLVLLPVGRRLPRERLTRWWNAGLLRRLHVRVLQHGSAGSAAQLLVANHVSWLDISVIAACIETRFVAKAEVQTWPLAGSLATAAGTFYLQRGAGETQALIVRLRRHLQAGGRVAVFPEGTTTPGDRLLRFQPRLFAAALGTSCTVQPVALRYGPDANGDNVAAFVGQQSLAANLWRLLHARELVVEVSFCPPVGDGCMNRDALARNAQCAIAAALILPVPCERIPARRLAA